MNPLKSHNIVAKILQVYAYVNGAVEMILTLSLVEDWGAVVAAIFFASSLVVNFLIFAWAKSLTCCKPLKRTQMGRRQSWTSCLTFKETST